ncbi:MAG TPA: substrate-binding domain-containing protein [Dokdonella sp.]|nr:substrate-binding domain-containing protein [Dokdonella sp.]HQX32323.1 substrate-binding domain-containing protein [Dokdonella sp.]
MPLTPVSNLRHLMLVAVCALVAALALDCAPLHAAQAEVQAATRTTAASTATAKPSIVWRGDIVSARGFVNDLVGIYKRELKGTLTVQPFSTISGIDAVISGSADVAGSARAMNNKRDTEIPLVFQPIALDAIVPITHPRNAVASISLAHLRQIYLGRINNWKELGGADAPINLYSIAAPLDGVEFSFRRLIYKRGEQRIAAPRLYLNTGKLEEAIALDPNGLGLSTLSSAYANRALKLLAVEGIYASTQSIADGSYPLFTTLYVVQREDSPNLAAIEGFVRFLGEAPAMDVMRRHQLVPYAEAGDVYSRDGARLAVIDAAIVAVTPADVAAMPRERELTPPLSAPRATLQAGIATAPGSESTQRARAEVDRAEAKKTARDKDAKNSGKSD